jgi:rhomboid family GlyGly-CTERM serine protease
MAMGAAAVAAWWIGAPAYDRPAIAQGEVWRLVTGHLTHWSAAHLRWDVLVFVMLGTFCERERGHRSFAGVLLAAALTVSAFLFFGCPEVVEYRGLSAIDSALWCWAAFIVAPRSLSLAILLLAVFAGKLMIELSTGAALFVPLAGTVYVLPLVHLVGATMGFCAVVTKRRIRRYPGKRSPRAYATRCGAATR